jgi:hypothetical protein
VLFTHGAVPKNFITRALGDCLFYTSAGFGGPRAT